MERNRPAPEERLTPDVVYGWAGMLSLPGNPTMQRLILSMRLLFYLLYGVVYLGFLLRDSSQPFILGYSKTYLVFLAAAAIPFLLPSLLSRLAKRVGRRSVIFALSPVGVLSVGTFLVAHFYHDYAWDRPFDPYFQAPPPESWIPSMNKRARKACSG